MMNDPLTTLKAALDCHPEVKAGLPRQSRYRLLAGKVPTIARYFLWIAHPALLRDWANRIENEKG
jgi:hypothetical protein